MLNGGILRKLTVGELDRTNNKVPDNPFSNEVQLINKFQTMSKIFNRTCGNRMNYEKH